MKQSDFKKGQRYRVTKSGAALSGMKPIAPYAQQGWAQRLGIGDVITCAGVSMTFGDGVPVVKWRGANNEWLANDCEFKPSAGGMWNQVPDASYLELVED
jgi:hypothetical protein